MDADGDGLSNVAEFRQGTNPLNADTDQDGMPDAWEQSMNLNPLSNDATVDPDNDQCSNLTEYQHQTHPHLADTDADGMPDGWEIDHQLNPLLNDAMGDSDNDGHTNLNEYQNGTNPQDPMSPLSIVNWALSSHGSTISGGSNSRMAIDGLTTNINSYLYLSRTGSVVTLDLQMPRTLTHTKLFFYDRDSRSFRIRMEASKDNQTWTEIVPLSTARSWTTFTFAAPMEARYLKLYYIGPTWPAFCLVEWEVYGWP
jgi:hypothetical protein